MKNFLTNEIKTNLSKEFKNLLKNSYPLLQNRNYGIIEFAIIKILSGSNQWTIKDKDFKCDESASDLIIYRNKTKYPISIKTSISQKSGIQLLSSRIQVEYILNELENNNKDPLINLSTFNVPILAIEYRNEKMYLNYKKCKYNNDLYIEWTKDLPKTATLKDIDGRSLLTFSRKKGTIAAYDGFFENTNIFEESPNQFNTVLYEISNILISEQNHEDFCLGKTEVVL